MCSIEIAAPLVLALVAILPAPALALAEQAPDPATATAAALSFPGVAIYPAERRMEIEAVFNLDEAASSPLEYLAVTDYGKVHESLFRVRCEPQKLMLGLILFGLEPRPEVTFQGQAVALTGPRVAIEAEWDEGASRRRCRVEDLVIDVRLGAAMERVGFAFTGSRFVPNPAARRPGSTAPKELLTATSTGSLVALYHDPEAVLDNPLVSGGDIPLVVPSFRLPEIVGWIPGDDRLQPYPGRTAPRGTRATLHIAPVPPGGPR